MRYVLYVDERGFMAPQREGCVADANGNRVTTRERFGNDADRLAFHESQFQQAPTGGDMFFGVAVREADHVRVVAFPEVAEGQFVLLWMLVVLSVLAGGRGHR